jgi:hypothetical protein
MFNHAIRHPVKKALIDICNNSNLSPLTLAAKLGRKELFLQCLELSHVVKSFYHKHTDCLITFVKHDLKKVLKDRGRNMDRLPDRNRNRHGNITGHESPIIGDILAAFPSLLQDYYERRLKARYMSLALFTLSL